MRSTLALALAVAVSALGLVAAAQAAPSTRPAETMHEIQLTGFKVSRDGVVAVFVKIRGWKMYPALVGKRPNRRDGGHWRIYVDGRYDSYSASATKGTTTKLKRGDHRIFVALANNDRSPVKGAHPSKTVTVMVG